MTPTDFIRFVDIAREKQETEEIREQWLQLLPLMQLKYIKYIPFEDYRRHCKGEDVDWRPAEVIIAEIEAAHEKMRKGEEQWTYSR